MAKNSGKIFESDFRSSVPSNILLIRLNDSPQAFSKSKLTRFTHRTPCDFLLFDGITLYPVELKTTKYRSMSFENVNDDEDQNKMIHKHQIIGLTEFSKYKNVKAGFFFNFRDEDKNIERCYFQGIEDFNSMVNQINKKSFNEIDLLTVGKAIKIQGNKKRTRWNWNLEEFFETYNN